VYAPANVSTSWSESWFAMLPVPQLDAAALVTAFHAAPDVGSAAISSGSSQIPLPVVGGGGGGAVIMIDAVPLFPPALALMLALPAAIPVTRPLGATVALVAAELDQVYVTPDMLLPF
jgi:hypothetical protein